MPHTRAFPQQAGNMAAQQRIAQGIQDNGFGDGGMLLGMNMAQAINPMTAAPVQAPAPTPAPEAAAPASHTASMSVEEQVEAMKKMRLLLFSWVRGRGPAIGWVGRSI